MFRIFHFRNRKFVTKNYKQILVKMKHLLIFFICCILSCNVYGIDIKGRFVTTSQMEPFRVVLTSCDTLNRTNVESTFYEPTFNVSILEKGRYTFEIFQNNVSIIS